MSRSLLRAVYFVPPSRRRDGADNDANQRSQSRTRFCSPMVTSFNAVARAPGIRHRPERKARCCPDTKANQCVSQPPARRSHGKARNSRSSQTLLMSRHRNNQEVVVDGLKHPLPTLVVSGHGLNFATG